MLTAKREIPRGVLPPGGGTRRSSEPPTGGAQREGIVISLEEVRRYYTSKVPRFRKRFERGDRRLAG